MILWKTEVHCSIFKNWKNCQTGQNHQNLSKSTKMENIAKPAKLPNLLISKHRWIFPECYARYAQINFGKTYHLLAVKKLRFPKSQLHFPLNRQMNWLKSAQLVNFQIFQLIDILIGNPLNYLIISMTRYDNQPNIDCQKIYCGLTQFLTTQHSGHVM